MNLNKLPEKGERNDTVPLRPEDHDHDEEHSRNCAYAVNEEEPEPGIDLSESQRDVQGKEKRGERRQPLEDIHEAGEKLEDNLKHGSMKKNSLILMMLLATISRLFAFCMTERLSCPM